MATIQFRYKTSKVGYPIHSTAAMTSVTMPENVIHPLLRAGRKREARNSSHMPSSIRKTTSSVTTAISTGKGFHTMTAPATIDRQADKRDHQCICDFNVRTSWKTPVASSATPISNSVCSAVALDSVADRMPVTMNPTPCRIYFRLCRNRCCSTRSLSAAIMVAFLFLR